MKHLSSILILAILPLLVIGQTVKRVEKSGSLINITLPTGVLSLEPLAENAIRVRFTDGVLEAEPSLILVSGNKTPKYRLSETNATIEVSTKELKVQVNRSDGTITFKDAAGKIFLKEKSGSRILKPNTVSGEKCFIAQQSFETPSDEYLFGLGQFQDGHLNLRGVTRKLTQVNSQISIPFIYSSKGYGLLWHQYGLTDFNPADNYIELAKQLQSATGNNEMAEVTTGSGSQKIKQDQSVYLGKFNLSSDGMYSIMLDLGDMGNRHYIAIDGKPCIDQSNYWLPPTVSAQVSLKAGNHTIQVVCKSSNNPKVSWKQWDNATTFRSPNAKALDYVVFRGENADDVMATYRNLSGNVPLLPLWAYGFWQCRERYSSSKQLIETVKEFRNRGIPLDVIVQDWQYWGKYGWGVMKFDEANYPDPTSFIKELHQSNAHFSVSVWENLNKASDIGKNYLEKNLYIPQSPWVDMLNPAARETHWNALNQNMFVHGVDSWWMDATEPENDALKGAKTYLGLGDFYRLTYPLFVSRAVYEGQRKTSPDKRVCILTRSAFAGQQRYGTINWSGDIGSTWDAYTRQIVAGLDYSISGMPYWTTDIGGFFRPGKTQYTDERYHELLIRWFQWGTFNPILRIHGYQTETEIWKYGPIVETNARLMLDLRYRLMPYIYSEAWQVTKNGSTIMRPMVMDFQNDQRALKQNYQFMFGKAFLVAPIIKSGASDWDVYLPQTHRWYDFWTGKSYKGGQTVKVSAPLSRIPVFVKAGSVVPMGKFLQWAAEKSADTLEIRIYTGANGSFKLYEDEGDNYNYEKESYSTIPFEWKDKEKTLVIGNREGKFPNMLLNRVFNIVWVNTTEGTGIAITKRAKKVDYFGKEVIVQRP